jgi:hypothetical protein
MQSALTAAKSHYLKRKLKVFFILELKSFFSQPKAEFLPQTMFNTERLSDNGFPIFSQFSNEPKLINPKSYSPIPQGDNNMSTKLNSLSNILNEVVKSMCSECTTSDSFKYKDKCCHRIQCFDCIDKCKCIKCFKKICSAHSVKCSICMTRVCKNANCITGMGECIQCNRVYCPEHFASHKNINEIKAYNMCCTSNECVAVEQLSGKGVVELHSYLAHFECLKEIKICKSIRRQLRIQ